MKEAHWNILSKRVNNSISESRIKVDLRTYIWLPERKIPSTRLHQRGEFWKNWESFTYGSLLSKSE